MTKIVSIDTVRPMLPSRKTITGKVLLAQKASEKGDIVLVTPDIIVADLMGLGRSVEEIPQILCELLENTRPDDYVGTHPPQRSYETVISGCELFAFKTTSKKIGCTVYYKFTIKDDKLWLVSLHRDRPEKKGK
ncbi:MAG: hypothetical protein WA096_02710 [Smithella sp.]